MTPERWRKIEELFHTAATKPLEEQSGFLARACAGDESLRREVDKLLARDRASDSSLDKITSEVATSWMLESERHELIGQSFGRYEILAPLGSGGMGEVYLARDKSLDRKVALKLLPRRFTQDRDRLRRFEQEARAASALNHPNIITIHEIGEWNGAHFIATEYIEGETLRDHMQTSSRELSEILEIGLQTAGALAAAHAAGIIHRDIKPANIMLRRDGYIKVLDFGLAKLSTASGNPDVTDPGRVMGTVNYMSPEQALGQPVDHRTDIFSLGAVLYEMATGRRAFEGKSDAAVYDGILNKTPPPLTDFSSELPIDLDQVIRRALEKDREHRYQTAADLRADLKLLAQGSGSTEAARVASRQRDARRRLTWRKAALAAVIIALASGSWFWQQPNKLINAGKKSVAVLPFKNLSADTEDAFLADGIHEEILNNLAKVSELKVISRPSVMRFREKERNLGEIANALHVSHIVEGSVQRASSRVQVTAQLIDPQTNAPLWAEKYDRATADLSSIQGDVAQAIAKQLRARLTSRERKAIIDRPTNNPAAYEAYLRGIAARAEASAASRTKAAHFFEAAVELDRNFALAWARLGMTNIVLHSRGLDRTPQRLRAAREAVEMALKLQPELAEAHWAQGYYYFRGEGDYAAARAAFEKARALFASDSRALQDMSSVASTLGNYPDAISLQQRAIDLDPRNPDHLFGLGWLHLEQRQFSEARAMLDRALELEPENARFLATKAATYQAEGNLQAAGEILKTLPLTPGETFLFVTQMEQFLLERRYPETILQLQAALENPAPTLGQGVARYYVLLGLAQERVGDKEGARATYNRGRDKIVALRAQEDDGFELTNNSAWILAGLGDKDAALAELDRAAHRWPDNRPMLAVSEEVKAAISARFGDADKAVRALQNLLATSYFYPNRKVPLTPALLQLDPIWDPLRADPGFQRLLSHHD
jgi:serine/threonine protein kinase/Tfp pilus assembly protein PilF